MESTTSPVIGHGSWAGQWTGRWGAVIPQAAKGGVWAEAGAGVYLKVKGKGARKARMGRRRSTVDVPPERLNCWT